MLCSKVFSQILLFAWAWTTACPLDSRAVRAREQHSVSRPTHLPAQLQRTPQPILFVFSLFHLSATD